jgi:predicted DCC family thiol-disulfide oxidoreductase YuxK
MSKKPVGEGLKPLVLYDGLCNLCAKIIVWLILNDRNNRIMLLPIQDEKAKAFGLNSSAMNSVVFISLDGQHFVRSSAVLMVLKTLGGGWRLLWFIIFVVPKPLRDWLYDLVAKSRYKWFGVRDICFYPDGYQ